MIVTMFATGEPSSRSQIVEALQNLHASSDRYLSDLPLSVFVAPQGSKWSPADHVRHLSKSTLPLVRALALPKVLLALRFGLRSRPSRPFVEVRSTYLKRLQEGVTAGRFAPSPQDAPDAQAWREQVMSSWRTTASGLHAVLGRWSEGALDRYRLPHPALGLLSVREMLFFTLYHNSHHLNLLAQRIESPEESSA